MALALPPGGSVSRGDIHSKLASLAREQFSLRVRGEKSYVQEMMGRLGLLAGHSGRRRDDAGGSPACCRFGAAQWGVMA